MKESALRNFKWALGYGANIVDWTTVSTRQIGTDNTAPTGAGEAEYHIIPWTEGGSPEGTVWTLNKNVVTGLDAFFASAATFGAFTAVSSLTETDLCAGEFSLVDTNVTPLVYTFTYDQASDYETLWADTIHVDKRVSHGDTVAVIAVVYEWGALATGGRILRMPWNTSPDTAQFNLTWDNDELNERYVLRAWKVEFGGQFNLSFPDDASENMIPFTGKVVSKKEAHSTSPLFVLDHYPIS